MLQLFPVEFTPHSYPNSGPIAVAARVAFVAAGLAVLIAAIGPREFKPRIVGHYHLARFAAWYILSGLTAAALPRTRLLWLGIALFSFAAIAETARALPQPFSEALKQNIYADLGGIYALMFPLALARWRDAVKPRIPKRAI